MVETCIMLVRYTFFLFGSFYVDSTVLPPKTEWPWDEGGRGGHFFRCFVMQVQKLRGTGMAKLLRCLRHV